MTGAALKGSATCDELSFDEALRVAMNVARAESTRLGVAAEELYSYAWEAIAVASERERLPDVPPKAWLIHVVRWHLSAVARKLRTFGPRSGSRVSVQSMPTAGDEWLPLEYQLGDGSGAVESNSFRAALGELTEYQRHVLEQHYGRRSIVEGHRPQRIRHTPACYTQAAKGPRRSDEFIDTGTTKRQEGEAVPG